MNKVEFISQLNDLVEEFNNSSEVRSVEVNIHGDLSSKIIIARELYRIVKYPNGPTIKKWQALLIEGKDFGDTEVQGKFIDAVETLID